jgi:TorA maturation chaperone TorD
LNDADGGTGAAPALEPEELARANFYGLISRLFYGPPDSKLLAEINRGGDAGSEEGETELVAAWRRLQQSCRTAFPPVVRQEYDSVFVGVGKAEVSPYLSGYAEPGGPDRYVVRLRDQLAAWNLARKDQVFEVEDHISGICDVMRWLIENQHSLAVQQRFFGEFAYPGVAGFCAAVQKSPTADFYKQVAALTSAYYELERAAFDMSDGHDALT